MEETASTLTKEDIISLISSTLNDIFSNLFASIDNTIYELLDKITILDSDYIIDKNLSNLFSSSKFNLLILANILLTGIIIYHIGKIILSIYSNETVDVSYMYILKIIIYAILMNNCLYICKLLCSFNYLISDYLLQLGNYLFDTQISFVQFVNIINDQISIDSNIDLFSIDGVIKCMLSFGFISLLISYILRFILLKFLIIIFPFFFIFLCEENLKPLFYNWIKYFFTLLFTQNLVILCLYLPYIFSFDNTLYSKFIILGIIYTLQRLNGYIKELIGGFALSNNISIQNIASKFIRN